MTKVLKVGFSHEPALVAGVVLGVGLFIGLRYGASASATAQASWPTALFTGLGFLSRFTTPAGKASLAEAPAQVGPLADDVGLLSQFAGELLHHPGGLIDLFESHWQQFDLAVKDAEQRILAVVHPQPAVALAVPPPTGTDLAEVKVTAVEPTPAEPDHLAALAAMLEPPAPVEGQIIP